MLTPLQLSQEKNRAFTSHPQAEWWNLGSSPCISPANLKPEHRLGRARHRLITKWCLSAQAADKLCPTVTLARTAEPRSAAGEWSQRVLPGTAVTERTQNQRRFPALDGRNVLIEKFVLITLGNITVYFTSSGLEEAWTSYTEIQ